ncbi:hypothetical protein KY289_027129, partial [Solanum tuberosum]
VLIKLSVGCFVGIEIDKVDTDQQTTMEEEITDQALVAMEPHNQMKIRDKHNQLFDSQIEDMEVSQPLDKAI